MKQTIFTAVRVLPIAVLLVGTTFAAPDYQQSVLESVFPAGAGRGQTVTVTFLGPAGALNGATEIIIDGAPGVTAANVQPAGNTAIKAELTIDADASPGRRMLRVKGGATGLTNFRWFFVSPYREHVEREKNNEFEQAETVTLPTVINGRVDPTLDQDCFRFQARAGQNLVAAVMSHGFDAMGYGRDNAGFADTNLELLDEHGRIVAEAGDTIGFDPLIEFRVPRDGWYTARVSGMGFKGFPQMVYRLTLGEVAYPTAIFPPGGRRGEQVEVEFFGPNVPPGTRRSIAVDDDRLPLRYVALDGFPDLPLLRGDHQQLLLSPNAATREQPQPISIPATAFAAFRAPSEEHWLKLACEKDKPLIFEITAQRHLRAPVDTLIRLFDAEGTLLAQNDDGEIFSGEVSHEFVPFDSYLEFKPKQTGDVFVCISEQSGTLGPRTAYRLSAHPAQPDFRVYQWPDALPIWGPSSSNTVVVELHRLGGLQSDVEISVEGLPPGWIGSTATAYLRDYRPPQNAFGHKLFLTITSPAEAEIGEMFSYRIVARTIVDDEEIVHTAQPLTHYVWGQPHRFRVSPIARAVVVEPAELRVTSELEELTGRPGDTVDIPLQLETQDQPAAGKFSLSINRAGTHFQCSVGPPVNVTAVSGRANISFKIPEKYQPGTYSIVIAPAWSSETRKGLPGPCTPLITLTVVEANAK